MEDSTALLASGAVDLAREFGPSGDFGESSLHRATRARSALYSGETFSHAPGNKLGHTQNNTSNNKKQSTFDLVFPKDAEGLNDDRSSGMDSRSAQFTGSKNKNKPTSHNSQTHSNQDGLTGTTAEDPLVGNRPGSVRVNRKHGGAGSSGSDLIGAVDDVTMPKTIDPRKKDDKGKIKVDITNVGKARASGSLAVDIYASPDLVLDASDQLLDSVNRGNVQIQAGNTRKFTFNFTNPAGVAPGAYYLIVDIDSEKTISESNETNNAAYHRVSASGTDVVVDWNATILNAIVATKSSPPIASRNMAILHTAMFNAVNKNSLGPVSREAAVAVAAHQILLNLYPTESKLLKEQLEMSLAEITNGQAKTRGITLGQDVAVAMLEERKPNEDGSGNSVPPYNHTLEPGRWRPTSSAVAVLPHWGKVTPFTLKYGFQFRSMLSGPPALSSAQYAAEVNQVQAVGSANSTNRTADQTESALFWADSAGTFTPPGHWNLVAEQLAVIKKNTLAENARLFALLNCAQADAGIAAWDAKYLYDNWRPVTAIRLADQDGNDATIADPFWTSLIPTPPFPDYVSGHSTFSGAASTILTSLFGENTSFSTTSIGLPGVVRSFTSFKQAADEAGMSRIYGGIHVDSANVDGLKLGRSIGQYTFDMSPFGAQLESPVRRVRTQSRSPLRANAAKQ
ncbi:CARDB domain-containing protein [Leptolyngbya sp. ST-U4]|uniref:CARDB domain-containing protein n=1 Tax=Leptolyngbya sp. ST-U4 TaxID=2933912 RepID=UPI003299DDDD